MHLNAATGSLEWTKSAPIPPVFNLTIFLSSFSSLASIFLIGFAGTPWYIHPGSSCFPGGTTLSAQITEPAPTLALSMTTACSPSTQPLPILQACTRLNLPTVTSSLTMAPKVVSEICTVEYSPNQQSEPTSIKSPSPRRVTRSSKWQRSPTLVLPMIDTQRSLLQSEPTCGE